MLRNTKRHNDLRDDIASALRKLPATEIITKPATREGKRRNDVSIRMRGPGCEGRRNIEYDLKVYAVNSTFAFRRDRGAIKPPKAADDPVQHYEAEFAKWMSKVESNTDKNKLETEARVSFKPLVFSAGGFMSKETTKEIPGWKLGKWELEKLEQQMSISLLVSRTRKMGGCLLDLTYLPGMFNNDIS